MSEFETKDSGVRAEYPSGMVRDTEAGKARFDLLFPVGVPYAAQMLTRFADLMARGAVKYDERNWEKARGEEELRRYRSSALRHLIQWMTDEDDEDHAAAVMFNILAGETVLARKTDITKAGFPLKDGQPINHDPENCLFCLSGDGGAGEPEPKKGQYVTCSARSYPHRFDPDNPCVDPVHAEGC